MIEKYFDGVVEQTFYQTGSTDKNIVLACYNNDFSVSYLNDERYSNRGGNVFFACVDLPYDEIVQAYSPFLDIVCDAFREFGEGEFEDFLDECGVYSVHKPILKSYFDTGICVRNEAVLLDEVAYEKRRMTEAIAKLMIKLSDIRPLLLVINRFNFVSKSAIDVVLYLLDNPVTNIGIVLGTNELSNVVGSRQESWNRLQEMLIDNNQLYHLGSSGKVREAESSKLKSRLDKIDNLYLKISNCYEMLEYEYMAEFLHYLERQAIEEELVVGVEWLRKLYAIYAKISIFTSNFSKALELISKLDKLMIIGQEDDIIFSNAMLAATCYMYLGRLEESMKKVEIAVEKAHVLGDEIYILNAELLKLQVQMSGWHNFFFCVSDVYIDEALIENLMKHGYMNNLAHIYIYAFDNGPEVVAKAYRSESLLINFSKGVELAKEIGNEYLVLAAYQKNIMIAATNGMNEIALLYTVRSYQFVNLGDNYNKAKSFVGIGYNLSALGHNDLAENYYNRAIELFYELRKAEDIAEVNYNLGLNYIMVGKYDKAEQALKATMKTVERLRLNSIRVCNLSKLYGLLAVVSILQGHRFDCERNLQNCSQFLNYIIEKEKSKETATIVHDYAKSDDDMFLYTYATALLHYHDGDWEEAFEAFQRAEMFLNKAEGNQFYVYECFKRSRMLVFGSMDKMELYRKEEASLNQHLKVVETVKESTSLEILEPVHMDLYNGPCCVSKSELDLLLKQAGTEKDFNISKKQMDFMSTWQTLIDLRDGKENSLVNDAIISFLTSFDIDKALFIRYEEEGASVVFNNTGIELERNILGEIYKSMDAYPNGFAISKISENFSEHIKDIECFGVDDVCSYVAVPCYTDGKVQAVFITYILMKDNWHNSVNRYMLNNDDLSFFRLLFKELNNAINLSKVNKKLEESAQRDMLTGLYNRVGMYKEALRLENRVLESSNKGIAVMFLDLDNFKPYNDTFGHDIGDLVLSEAAKIFKSIVGDDGFVSRYGGDEFIIIINTDNRSRLEDMAKTILDKMHSAAVFKEVVKDRPDIKPISCSIGITTNTDDTELSVDEMIKKADDLMYKVKTGSKGTYTFL